MLRKLILLVLLLSLVACSTLNNKKDVAQMNVRLGINYYHQGEIDFAITKFRRALKIDPKKISAHLYLAEAYGQIGQHEAAIGHYRKAIKLQPKNSAVRNNFGVYLCRNGKIAEAEKEFLSVLKNRKYATPELVYENLGLCAQKIPDQEKAETYFLKALEKKPEMGNVNFQLVGIRLALKKYAAALEHLKAYHRSNAYSAESLYLGITLSGHLNDATMQRRFEQLLVEKFPRSSPARQLAGEQ